MPIKSNNQNYLYTHKSLECMGKNCQSNSPIVTKKLNTLNFCKKQCFTLKNKAVDEKNSNRNDRLLALWWEYLHKCGNFAKDS